VAPTITICYFLLLLFLSFHLFRPFSISLPTFLCFFSIFLSPVHSFSVGLFLFLTLQSKIFSYLSQYFTLIIFSLSVLSCVSPSQRVADRSHLNCLNCPNKFGHHLSPTYNSFSLLRALTHDTSALSSCRSGRMNNEF
jgi:hypothetical protein